MHNETLKQTYDTWHSAHPIDADSDTPWHLQLKLLLPSLAGKRVLEIGCGRGGFAAWLAQLPLERSPLHLVASDFSPRAIEMAQTFGQSKGVENVTYQVDDLMGLGWPDASFDVAISCETIEHVPNPRRALSELFRVLKPGGNLYLTCPNYLNLSGLHRLYREWTGRPFTEEGQPINHFLLLPRVRNWVNQVGFTIKHTGGTGHYMPWPGRPPVRQVWVDHLPLARFFALHALIVANKR